MLLSKGYIVHGIVRRASLVDRPRLDHLTADHDIYGSRLFLHYGDLDDVTTLRRLLRKIRPDEFYHLAGQSHVGLSFEIPESTCDFTAMGMLRILEIIRDLDRPPHFLNTAARIALGEPERLTLGNLDGARDWGYAPEYVEAMWRMLQAEAPEDLVIATGKLTTVREFLDYAFTSVGLDWKDHVDCDDRFRRPADATLLVGDPSRAKAAIGWEAKTGAAGLAEVMVQADLAQLRHQGR